MGSPIIKKNDTESRGVSTYTLADRGGGHAGDRPAAFKPPAAAPRHSLSSHAHSRALSEGGVGVAEIPGSEDARRSAERAIQQAHERSILIEKEAYEKGYMHGEQAGMELANKKAEAMLARYLGSIEEISRLRNEVMQKVEKDVVRLALAIARKIIHREIQVDQEIILTMVRISLSRIGEKSQATVHLNPTDFKYVLEHKGRLGSASELAGITLVEDPVVARGGCLIDTEIGSIDARVDEQLREIERGLLGT